MARRSTRKNAGEQVARANPGATRKSARSAKTAIPTSETTPTYEAPANKKASSIKKRGSKESDPKTTKKQKRGKDSAEAYVRAQIKHAAENPSVFHKRFAGLASGNGTPAANEATNSSSEGCSPMQSSPEDSSTTESTPVDAGTEFGFLGEDIEGELEDDNVDDTIDDEPEAVDTAMVQLSMNCVAEAQNREVDFAMQEYVERLDRKIILLGSCKVPKDGESTNTRGQEMLSADNKDLFRFVNKVLQSSACSIRTDMWWRENTIRLYKYAIRDYVDFMSTHKIEDVPVTKDNFRVDGIYIVQCMKALVAARDARAGRRCPGYNKTLKTFKSALQGLQQLLALYQCAEIPNERLREEAFTERSVVRNMHLVTTFLAERLKQCVVLQRENFDNKDRDNMFFDRYTTDQAKQMVTNVLKETALGGKIKIYGGINAALELLLGHHLLFRGADKRKLELSDSVYSVQKTSRGKIPILGFQLTQSKTLGPDGRPRCMGTCRSKDVEMCLVSAFAFSLWHRFDYPEGSLYRRPDFTSKQSWYPIKVLFSHTLSSQLNNEICYNHEKNLMNMCTDSIGFSSSKITHLGRKSGAQSADAHNISEEQILRAGMWSNNALVKYYLSPFPYDFIHYSAGFEQHETYFINRDIDVDQRLQDKIFPWLDEEIANLNEFDREESHNGAANKEHRERDGTVRKFLDMLKQFRPIIIQDLAAKMMSDAPIDDVFTRHPITRDADFKEFCNQMKTRLESKSIFPNLPNATRVISMFSEPISQAIRHLASGMQNGFKENARHNLRVERAIDEFRSMLEDRDKQFVEQRDEILDIKGISLGIDKKVEDTFQEVTLVRSSNSRIESSNSRIEQSLNLLRTNHGIPSSGLETQSTFLDSTLTASPQIEPEPESFLNQVANDLYSKPNFEGSEFDFQPNNATVIDLLSEWYISTPSRLSVHERDMRYQKKWLTTPSRSQRHKRNLTVIKFLQILSENIPGPTLYQLGRFVDVYRGSRTLPKFITEVTQKPVVVTAAVQELKTTWERQSEDSRTRYHEMFHSLTVPTSNSQI